MALELLENDLSLDVHVSRRKLNFEQKTQFHQSNCMMLPTNHLLPKYKLSFFDNTSLSTAYYIKAKKHLSKLDPTHPH